MIFARERTQGVWRILPPPKCAKHEEAEAYSKHNHQGRRPRRPTSEPEPQRRRTVPSAPTQPAVADVQEAEAGGAL